MALFKYLFILSHSLNFLHLLTSTFKPKTDAKKGTVHDEGPYSGEETISPVISVDVP